jgi:hypothetical protein
MADCPFTVQNIDKTECIGNSLAKINNNFSELKTDACQNFSTIETLQANIQNLDSRIIALSGITVPGVAKAWVKFDGTRDTSNPPIVSTLNTNRFIYSSYNIVTAYRKSAGDYRITFTTPMPNNRYILLGTSSQKQASTGLFTWLQPYRYTTTYADVRVTSINAASVVDAEHISIVVY